MWRGREKLRVTIIIIIDDDASNVFVQKLQDDLDTIYIRQIT